ncbi:septum formation initiator family protein [Yinghuangia sp. ASG 101]|uniref:septum formation initiator family protein n=1 Tax=Yinghuangia sp. ASG 101 TaxID=2896848 RepID=UPI001E64CE8D|nr:septum formation initiator family protein [Yinghuangia sp. ASG 101]UGQ09342.1 septum formation initiator family protein [Yinghuangia sp. ASG 101]
MSETDARKGTGPGKAKSGANRTNGTKPKSTAKRRRIVVTWGGPKGRPNRLTGRAGVLVLVVSVLAIALVVPVRQYLDQRRDRDGLRVETERRRDEVERLREELERWQDPAFIRQQARGQLHYVNPGDTAYSVIPPPPVAPSPGESPKDGSWTGELWTTVQDADAAPAPNPSAAPSP